MKEKETKLKWEAGDRRFDEKGFFGKSGGGHRLGCTCSTLIIFLILILSGLIFAVFMLSKPATNVISDNQNNNSQINSTSTAQIEKALEEDSDNVTINISEEEFDTSLPAGTDIVIQPDGMYIYSQTFGFDTVSEVEPVAEGGQLKFNVKKVTIGSLPVPKLIASSILGRLTSELDKINSELSVINIETVSLNSGYLSLFGRVVGR